MKFMKNRKYRKYSLLAVSLALMISSGSANVTNAQEEGLQSIVSIEFEEGDANVGPVDPEDPETPGNGGSGESGSLALNHVSHFFFDREEILTQAAEYPTTTQRPYIQITDARGTWEGWSVSARASKFINEKGGESLFGASMKLKNASLNSPTPELPPPQPKPEVTLNFNDSDLTKIVSAEENTGMGTWLVRWYTDPDNEKNDSVLLRVPGGSAMKGENRATITWILSSGPA